MEARVLAIMADIEAAGGMYSAVESGMVQTRIGESARRHQDSVDSGAQTVVGVNAYQVDEDASARPALAKPDPAEMNAHRLQFAAWKASRSPAAVQGALDALARSAQGDGTNIFGHVVSAAEVGCSHGEICGTLRRELGFGHPLIVV
jgi:methylmalonyl-CoA mutase N-terminal domain/subunit